MRLSLTHQLRATTALAALAILTSAVTAQTVDGKPEIKSKVLDRVTSLLSNRAFVPGLDFAKWKEFAQNEKSKLDASKDDDDFARAVNEALDKFGASHIALMTPRAADYRVSNSIVGIGITQQKTEAGTLIYRTIKGAPADQAGLIPGDVITKVDGQAADGAKGIAGKEGTTVKLTVKHADGKTQEYTLTRRKFSTVRPEELIEESKDTARLVIPTFDLSYDRDNVEALMTKASKYSNLIVDLRDNGGGAVVNMQHLLGLLMPADKPIGTFVTRGLVNDYVSKTGGTPKDVVKIADWSRKDQDWTDEQILPYRNRNVGLYKGRVTVLVNRGSASASEISAAALHDVIGADVVGTKSMGAVLVSVIVPAANGFTLQYPISDYVTVKGLRIEGNGVAPTTEVEDAKLLMPADKDPVVQRAVENFGKSTKV